MNLFEVCKNIRGFQYFPSHAATLFEMWHNYQHELWRRELPIARRVGANTLRFWLSPKAFQTDSKTFLDALDDALGLARENGLFCIVGLFNAWPTQDPENWTVGHLEGSDMTFPQLRKYEPYVKETITRFLDDPRILMWEVINEPGIVILREPEFEMDSLVSFCEYWYAFIKGIGALQPLTVGCLPTFWIGKQITHCQDVLSFHLYDTNPQKFARMVTIWKNIASGAGKPIFCGETGSGKGGEENHVKQVKWQTELLEEHGLGFSIPWLVQAKAATTCPERSEEGLGNEALFLPDGTPRESGRVLRWTKKITSPIVGKESSW